MNNPQKFALNILFLACIFNGNAQNIIARIDSVENSGNIKYTLHASDSTLYLRSDTIEGYEIIYYIKNTFFGGKSDISDDIHDSPYLKAFFFANKLLDKMNLYFFTECKDKLYYIPVIEYESALDPSQDAINKKNELLKNSSDYQNNFNLRKDVYYVQLNDSEIIEINKVKVFMDIYKALNSDSKKHFSPLFYYCPNSGDSILRYNKIIARLPVKNGSFWNKKISYLKDRTLEYEVFGKLFWANEFEKRKKKAK
jgi:hypothetical protein